MVVVLSLSSPPAECIDSDICIAVYGGTDSERSRKRLFETAVRIAMLVGDENMVISGIEDQVDARWVAKAAVDAMRRGICVRIQGAEGLDVILEACRISRRAAEAWLEPIAAAIERTAQSKGSIERRGGNVRSPAPSMLKYYIEYVGNAVEACRRIEERYVASIAGGESIRSAWKRFVSEERDFLEFLSRLGMRASFSSFYRAINRVMEGGCSNNL